MTKAEAFPRHISESVYLLGNHYFQSYLVRGECCALVEGGVTWSVPQVVAQLEELKIAAGELQYLIIPHAHFDHVCGIPGLKEAFPHLEVLASGPAASVLGKEKVITGFFNEDRSLIENLQKKGESLEALPPALQQAVQSTKPPALPAVGFPVKPAVSPPATIAVDGVITEGDELDLGRGRILQFSLLPGHSPCSMAAYLPSEQVLFSSDCGGYPISEDTIFPMYFAGYEDYVHSLQRLSEIEASVLAAPHELLITGQEEISSYFRRSQASTAELYEFILKEFRNGKNREEISQGLFQKYYRGGMANYSVGNIMVCTDLLVRRTLETVGE